MSIKDQNELIVKAIKWAVSSSIEIFKAGGVPDLINSIPEDMLATMVRNNLVLKYAKP